MHDRAYELARAFKSGTEYREYQKAQQELDETARQMVRDLRLAEAKLQVKHMSGGEIEADERRDLERLQELVSLHQPILAFLAAERRLMIMINDVQRILGDSLEIWDYDLQQD